MIAVDTSVVVPAFASWHEAHGAAIRLLAESPALPAHVAVEAYSVLTRLPMPHRVPGTIVIDYLDRVFPPDRRLVASAETQIEITRRCAAAGVDGGGVYDALVAATVLEHGATLVTRDRRAAPVYRAIGVDFRLDS